MLSRSTLTVLSLLVVATMGVPALSQSFKPSSIKSVVAKARDGEDVIVRGTIKGYVDSDDLILDDGTSTIVVDVDSKHERLGLAIGATIVVVGEVDRDDGIDIDADWVHVVRKPSATIPALQTKRLADVFNGIPDGRIVVVECEVTSFLSKDEIVVTDDSGSMTVDLDDEHHLNLGLKIGQNILMLAEVDLSGVFDPVKELDAKIIRKQPKSAVPAKTVVVAQPLPPAPKPVTVVKPQPPAKKSLADRLAILKSLHDQGLITAEEYAERKRAILDEI
ncbi:MAG: hypothetical protein CMJ83_15620 [Planctomycetes bacterium]|nr:hypothetical protein [Planctomycetota bacterium]